MVIKLASKLSIICRSTGGLFGIVSIKKLSQTAISKRSSIFFNEIGLDTYRTKRIDTLLHFPSLKTAKWNIKGKGCTSHLTLNWSIMSPLLF